MCTCVVHEECVEVVIETVWSCSSEEGGKRKRVWKEAGKRKRRGKKKRGERGFGELWVFLVFFD